MRSHLSPAPPLRSTPRRSAGSASRLLPKRCRGGADRSLLMQEIGAVCPLIDAADEWPRGEVRSGQRLAEGLHDALSVDDLVGAAVVVTARGIHRLGQAVLVLPFDHGSIGAAEGLFARSVRVSRDCCCQHRSEVLAKLCCGEGASQPLAVWRVAAL